MGEAVLVLRDHIVVANLSIVVVKYHGERPIYPLWLSSFSSNVYIDIYLSCFLLYSLFTTTP